MADQLTIINRALLDIGEESITSLTQGGTPANACGTLYPSVVEDLLSRHRWDFGKAQVRLTRLVDAPMARWDAAYQLPPGLKNVVSVLIGDYPIPFDRYDDKIFCNATTADVVTLEYADQTTETRWPAWFATLVEFSLAARIAIPVGDRADLSEWYEKKADRHFALCKQLNGQGHTTKKLPTGRFRRARWGGTTELV